MGECPDPRAKLQGDRSSERVFVKKHSVCHPRNKIGSIPKHLEIKALGIAIWFHQNFQDRSRSSSIRTASQISRQIDSIGS